MRPSLLAVLVAVLPSYAAFGGPKPHSMNAIPTTGGPTSKSSVCGVKVFPLAVGNSWKIGRAHV